MSWRYKTVHYGLKKEGLLGSTFFDEEEMEQSLNDYGEKGWELVSLLEVRDGVVAVFKQEKEIFEAGSLGSITPVAEVLPEESVEPDELAPETDNSSAIDSEPWQEEFCEQDTEDVVVSESVYEPESVEDEIEEVEGVILEETREEMEPEVEVEEEGDDEDEDTFAKIRIE